MAALNIRTPAVWICAGALAVLAGCEQSKHNDLGWAQASLERNGNLQVLSVDPKARAFTVRMKDSGELRIVRLDEIVGSLPSIEPVSKEAPKAAAPAPALAETPPSPAAAPEPAAAPVAQIMPAPPPQPTLAQMSQGPGVLKSGPGYVIKRTPTPANARPGFAPADLVARGIAVERRDEPIICQGARFVRIDSRNLKATRSARKTAARYTSPTAASRRAVSAYPRTPPMSILKTPRSRARRARSSHRTVRRCMRRPQIFAA